MNLCLEAGFRGYREKTTVGPLSQFSCFVGPNGAGKSVLVSGTEPLLCVGLPCFDLMTAFNSTHWGQPQGDALAFVLSCNQEHLQKGRGALPINDDLLVEDPNASAKVNWSFCHCCKLKPLPCFKCILKLLLLLCLGHPSPGNVI